MKHTIKDLALLQVGDEHIVRLGRHVIIKTDDFDKAKAVYDGSFKRLKQGIPETKRCRRCFGRGWIKAGYNILGDAVRKKCPDCNGTRRVEA